MDHIKFNRYCGWILKHVTTYSLLGACTLMAFYLSVMRVEPFLQGGVAVAGIFIAICSIMYSRAALSFDNDNAKKLAIQAADDSFMGTLLALAYFITSCIVFFLLYDSGNYPPVEGKLEADSWLPVPAACAMVLHFMLALPAFVKITSAIEKTVDSWALTS